jgi:sulfhydrogenase subunit delta
MKVKKPKLAVFKFASCDGCQLTLLDCEDELLTIASEVTIANFLEASRAVLKGPYDLTLVEGSITTPHDAERIQLVRAESKVLVTIGACATAGGIQALRNFQDVAEFARIVYARPEYISTLQTSTAIADHVQVDFELRGCPVDKRQLLELIGATLAGRKPNIFGDAVCTECKARGVVCLAVAEQIPCLGPVTHAGCGALCPRYGRGCFGCFGPKDVANPHGLVRQLKRDDVPDVTIRRLFASFNANAPAFCAVHTKTETPHG